MTRVLPGERSAALGRVLADAERAAWAGDSRRARRLLRLAERLAPADERAEVLVAAESVRSAAAERQRGPSSRGVVEPVRLPRLRPLQEQLVLGSPPAAVEAGDGPRSTSGPAPPSRRPRVVPLRRLVGGGAALLLLAGMIAGRAHAARLALNVGQPAIAVGMLRNARRAEEFFLRADARAAAGDTAAAILDYVAAAHAATRDGEVAWEAGAALQRMRGQERTSAEALLRAYVLGINPTRWDAIAAALDRAGRHEEAQRVRAGSGR